MINMRKFTTHFPGLAVGYQVIESAKRHITGIKGR